MNLRTLSQNYSTQERCRELLRRLRWPDGVRCLRCEHSTVCWLKTQEKYECGKCGYQFSVTTQTIFHDSHLSLDTWFLAVHLMTQAKKGMSAHQMMRTLGIGGYKTAWYLCHRIRNAMKDANPAPLKGTIEYDETWHGGKTRGRGKGYVGNKTNIMGAFERGGGVRFRVEKRVTGARIQKFLDDVTGPETKRIYTDAHPNYQMIDFRGAVHEQVDHRAQQWVNGDCTTNGIESVWSLVKRSVVGSYHHLSEKHLPAYLDEISFRFERRNETSDKLFLDTLQRLVQTPCLKFKELTKSEDASISASAL